MKQEDKIHPAKSYLLLLGIWLLMCLVVALICSAFDLPTPKGLTLFLVMVVPAYLLRLVIVRYLERRQSIHISKEVIDNVAELLMSGKTPWCQDYDTQMGYNIIAPILQQIIIRDREAIISGFTQEGNYKQGKELAILACLINKTSWDLLATGKYHLYRGILTEPGKSLKRLFYKTMHYLQEEGFIDTSIAENWTTILEDEIRMVG